MSIKDEFCEIASERDIRYQYIARRAVHVIGRDFHSDSLRLPRVLILASEAGYMKDCVRKAFEEYTTKSQRSEHFKALYEKNCPIEIKDINYFNFLPYGIEDDIAVFIADMDVMAKILFPNLICYGINGIKGGFKP